MAAKEEAYSIKETYVTSALLTVPEAAKYLGVGRKKIYEFKKALNLNRQEDWAEHAVRW